jgi:hypothetical protein
MRILTDQVCKTEMRQLLQSTRSRLVSAFLLHEGWNVNEHDSAAVWCATAEAVVIPLQCRNCWRFANQPVAVRTIFGILCTHVRIFLIEVLILISESFSAHWKEYHPSH